MRQTVEIKWEGSLSRNCWSKSGPKIPKCSNLPPKPNHENDKVGGEDGGRSLFTGLLGKGCMGIYIGGKKGDSLDGPQSGRPCSSGKGVHLTWEWISRQYITLEKV